MIAQLFQNLLIHRIGSSLVNKTMTMRTLGIPGRNRIKILINIKSKNLINKSKEREAGEELTI